MKAAHLIGPGQLEVRTGLPLPPHGSRSDAALVRVTAVGICGTDVSIAAGKIPVVYPRIPGHEIVGTVEESASSRIRVGARVIVDPVITCGNCRQCRAGRSNICSAGGLLGRDLDGGLQELISVPSEYVHEIPAEIRDEVAPLIQVLTTCVHAQHRTPISSGESVVVLGLGVTGLLHVQLAMQRGAQPVVGISRTRAKLELARQLGAHQVMRADGDDIAAVMDACGGADLVIESVGSVASLSRAMRLAVIGGRILSYGVMTETPDGLPYYDIYFKELSIVGARAAVPADFSTAIELVGNGSISLDPLISARYPLYAAAEALAAAADPRTLKVVVDVEETEAA